ncbi:MAG: Hint domain-containing protein [Loktanella sp.]|nr:Hint domain-containing protein [Loktanella sp.]
MFDSLPHANAFADATLSEIATGLVAGTKVATKMGWRVVEAIAPGDMVLTFDGGMQEVKNVTRQVVWAGGDLRDPDSWPLFVPAGALGNQADMSLMPGQAVLVESDTAEAVFGDPFAMIPAKALDGFRGITPTAPSPRIEVVTLEFAQDEVVFANIGALFFCPAAVDIFSDRAEATYACLTLEQADLLVSFLEEEDMGRASPQRAVAAFRVAA